MSRYIDADALVESMMPIYKSASYKNRNVFSAVKQCMEAIKNFPATEVWENVRGEWIDEYEDSILLQRCSICGYEEYFANRPNFCPHCGADMRGDKE